MHSASPTHRRARAAHPQPPGHWPVRRRCPHDVSSHQAIRPDGAGSHRHPRRADTGVGTWTGCPLVRQIQQRLNSQSSLFSGASMGGQCLPRKAGSMSDKCGLCDICWLRSMVLCLFWALDRISFVSHNSLASHKRKNFLYM